MIVLVSSVGQAGGARAAAAALACLGSDSERAALLVEVGDARPPRPSLVATAPARQLEERLATHLPGAAVASRGRFCTLTLSGDSDEAGERGWLEGIAAAVPLVRDSLAAIHLPPGLLQEALGDPRVRPGGALLRADLAADRALTALAVGDLMERGLEVVVLKRPLAWLAGRAAMLGALPEAGPGLPARAGRLLS
jgi:hypothetical protein